MYFFNEYEIEMYVRKHAWHEVLGPATKLLSNLKDLVNENSDGWCHWKAHVVAAKKLMELIAKTENPSLEEFKKAKTPIKSFCTKHRLTFPGEK